MPFWQKVTCCCAKRVQGKPIAILDAMCVTGLQFEEAIYVLIDDGDKVTPLNSTQSVVIVLINLLPKSTYHVFVDNPFSSPGLFLSLRQHGHGATGTVRPNCGIFKSLIIRRIYQGNQGLNSMRSGSYQHPDNQVGALGTFGCVSLTNLSSSATDKPNRVKRQCPCVIPVNCA